MTPAAIREAFKNLRSDAEMQHLADAARSRSEADWLVGINGTRAMTAFNSKDGGFFLTTVGRVQTPTLALIVKRQEEIENFKPEPYWVLTTNYRDTTFTAVLQTEEEEAAEAAKQGNSNSNAPVRRGFTSEEEGREALEKIRDAEFFVTSVTKKNGTEAPPHLYDLTSLQVDCNKKFGYSSDLTLQLIQSLYEKKVSTYPRVDTTFLPDDVYPKCGQIMNGLKDYFHLMDRIKGQKLRKDKKFFDNSKVTDHHAIIPTGQPATSLTEAEKKVFDLIARRFIGIFYPDCLFETTTITGEVGDIAFRATGKHITDPAWKVLWSTNTDSADSPAEEKLLPEFVKGESGPHTPDLAEKQTTPPKPYTEATLLRAMETAGKMVEDEELRDALKENGIGRPSTRAAIIETLFRRRYIRKERTSLWATPAGVELIGIIHEELLKSAELTGQWEKKLRDIEKQQYKAGDFINELKTMLTQIVNDVLSDNSRMVIN